MSFNKILAALLVIAFALFTLPVIVSWSVQANLLNDDAYVQALDDAGFFEVPYGLIHDGEIPVVGGLLLTEGPLAAVSGADMEAVARELAPPDWLHAQLERAVRDLVAVAAAPEPEELPDLLISLQELKARALGEPGDRALARVVQALPVCPPGQAAFDPGSDTPLCFPSEIDQAVFVEQIRPLLPPLVERLPDTYRLSWQPEQRDVLQDLKMANRTLGDVQALSLFLLLLNLALLGTVWVLAVRSPAEWLRWTGGPLLLLGLLALGAGLAAPRAVNWWLENSATWTGINVPARLDHVLELTIIDLAGVLFRPALLAGAALACVGLLLALLSPFFPGRRGRASRLAR